MMITGNYFDVRIQGETLPVSLKQLYNLLQLKLLIMKITSERYSFHNEKHCFYKIFLQMFD